MLSALCRAGGLFCCEDGSCYGGRCCCALMTLSLSVVKEDSVPQDIDTDEGRAARTEHTEEVQRCRGACTGGPHRVVWLSA